MFDTDRYYTNGMKISWISRDLSNYRDMVTLPWMQRLIERLPLINDPGEQHTVSVSLGQNMYTPEDKKRTDLIKNDRPYAGITYLALGLHSRNSSQMDTLELDIGIVGRHSYAEDCQTEFHEWIGSEIGNGWDNQLHDEPILNLYFERKWKILQIRSSEGFGFDCIPYAGLAAGNAYTGANLGGQVRFGWNIPNDFGTNLIRPASDSSSPLDDTDPRFFRLFHSIGIHLFLALTGKLSREIFYLTETLSGTVTAWTKSPSVPILSAASGSTFNASKSPFPMCTRQKSLKRRRMNRNSGRWPPHSHFKSRRGWSVISCVVSIVCG